MIKNIFTKNSLSIDNSFIIILFHFLMNFQMKPYYNPSTCSQINLDISWKFDKHSIYFCQKQTKYIYIYIYIWRTSLTLTATCNIKLSYDFYKRNCWKKVKGRQSYNMHLVNNNKKFEELLSLSLSHVILTSIKEINKES